MGGVRPPGHDRANPHVSAAAQWGDDHAPIAVIAVHGRTQSPSDMRALADRLGVEGLRWSAPAAAGNSWYPYPFMHERPEDDPWLEWSLSTLDAAVGELEAQGYPAERIVLMGFSQGACLNAHWALTRPRRYAGLALLTGGYIGTPAEPVSFAGDVAGTPVVLAGCERDPWVPRVRMAETAEHLRALGAAVTALVEPGDVHEVTDNAAELTRQLLRRALAQSAAPDGGAHP